MRFMSFVFLFFLSLSAMSHKVLTMIYTTGMTVEGQIAFSDGSFAPKDTLVKVFDNEQAIEEVSVDEYGGFIYQAPKPSNYRFYVDMGAGHIASMTVKPEDFISFSAAEEMDNTGQGLVEPTAEYSKAMFESVVAKQIRPLREEIFALKEKRYWMDILGGIGFILGLFGITAWMQSRKYAKPSS